MRALTIHEPWASLIAAGRKRHETRSFPTRHRGLLAIHAAKAWGPEQRANWLAHVDAVSRPTPRLGCVVAVVRVDSCDLMDEALIAAQTDEERAVGDWRPGLWAWRLGLVLALPTPVEASGRQRIWTLPYDVWDEVDQSMVRAGQGALA